MRGVFVGVLAVVGFVVSGYALFVERRARRDPSYRAVCDVKESMSCVRAFTSLYGRLAGISNSVVGLVFYAVVFFFVLVGWTRWVFYLAVLSFLGSLCLAYVSYVKMRNFCVVCTVIYLVNTVLVVASFLTV